MILKSFGQPPWLRDVFVLRKRKGIDRQHRLLVEGSRLTRAALAAGVRFEQVLFAPEFFDDTCSALVDAIRATGAPAREIPAATFSRLSYKAEGVLGVVRFEPPRLDAVMRRSLVVVLDALSDPGNIGAVLRTVDAWGPAGVVVVDGHEKLFHPKALRASMGAVFHTSTCTSTRGAAIESIAASGRAVVALTPDGTGLLGALPFTGDMIIVLGNEKRGVHPDWARVTTSRVAIPTAGIIDSLNVATAAAIVLWETYRARIE